MIRNIGHKLLANSFGHAPRRGPTSNGQRRIAPLLPLSSTFSQSTDTLGSFGGSSSPRFRRMLCNTAIATTMGYIFCNLICDPAATIGNLRFQTPKVLSRLFLVAICAVLSAFSAAAVRGYLLESSGTCLLSQVDIQFQYFSFTD